MADSSGNYELNHENTNTQFRGGTADTAMNETSHKQRFQHTDSGYNEQRDNYTEQAFNDYVQRNENMSSAASEQESAQDKQNFDQSKFIEAEFPGGSSGQLTIGQAQAESPYTRYTTDSKIYRTDYRIAQNREKIEKYDAAADDVVQKTERYYGGRSRIRQEYLSGKRLSGSKRLVAHSDFESRRYGCLQHYYGISTRKATQRDYEDLLNKKTRKRVVREQTGRLLFRKVSSLWRDDNISDDENIRNIKRRTGRLARGSVMFARHNMKNLKQYNSVYYRRDLAQMKEQILLSDRNRLQNRKDKEEFKKKIREQQSREQKKKLKKAMVQYQKVEQGNFARRTWQNIVTGIKKRKYERMARKRVMKVALAGTGLFVFLTGLFLVMFLIIMAVTYGGSETAVNTISMNDYSTLTEAMAYLNDKEVDLDAYLNLNRDELEAELNDEYGPDIYEYVYDLAGFGFSANNLMAYLSTKYGTFTIDDVKAEMDDIFNEMYTLTAKIKLENREVQEVDPETGNMRTVTKKVKICYVTLTKKDLNEIIGERLSYDDTFTFTGIMLSGGGQQIFNPVMKEDWTDKISSNFGARFHPIDGVVKQHNGVDIAVPEGTQLYSAVKGTVTTATYSDSTGYMVTITDDDGYKVIYMHMKSYSVGVNQKVEAGQFIGLSGNTGKSTGPHLHLGVQDSEGVYYNPILFIPSTAASSDE